MNKIIQTIIDGATYAGAAGHSFLNYTLILITLFPYILPGLLHQRRVVLWAFLASLFVQVLFWFTLKATGVSVVWCAMAGFSLAVFIKDDLLTRGIKSLLLISMTMALAGIIYYAVTFPPITTIAHIAAVVMGIGLYFIGNRLASQWSPHRRSLRRPVLGQRNE